MSTAGDRDQTASPAPAWRALRLWFGPIAVVGAVACALATFFILAELSPIAPTGDVVFVLFLVDAVALVLLAALVVAKAGALISAWRRGEAAAGLHIRIVGFFSVLALAPAIILAIVGSITLERALNPKFLAMVKTSVHSTAEAARVFRETQCRSLLQEAQLSASDLDRARAMFNADRGLFHEFFASRARFLGFSVAAIVTTKGEIVERVDVSQDGSAIVIAPPQADFDDARRGEPLCLVIDEGRTFVALRPLSSYPDTFLYATRPVDPFGVQFPEQAASLIATYDAFDAYRGAVKKAFVVMYALLAMIMLLSAVWVGLDFANRLVAPIRALIAATDQVSAGNLDVRVEVERSQGDLAHLGDVFNNMTTELEQQQRRLISANRQIDERRRFTEAVLSGVPAAVIGIDAEGRINVLNRSAEELLVGGQKSAAAAAIGKPAAEAMPEIAPILADAIEAFPRAIQRQIMIRRGGKELTLAVRVTSAATEEGGSDFVVTLDDITDLVVAQRTSAWADVARRIAHEIKNPLTPIQLSAERLKRKYGKHIAIDRDIFDQCTDTIVRQVDDIKRMVDEFSSFARMPKARPERDDLCECVRQAAFLQRVAHNDVEIALRLPDAPTPAFFDRRLLSQALTNIVKNAAESIAARDESAAQEPKRIEIDLTARDGLAQIDVIDNGKGFPAFNRQRLLEPYMTTRAEGTGLGLPIVAKIIEDHGGRLELLDAPSGRGACVRLLLPLGGEPAREEPAPVRAT
ncbi:PAS domain-containing sensor histidine kinase [Methylosinus sp. Sm6]|uniref:sensor histidine kinase NtrY-like n=1 Tax=Methylosinus sp. Sm6 TaxID=2866948 RepID=UPI001C9918D7|nr:PAS domain-containing sensor histidine kinase [Methylosinus sp. Sm6]MBY6240216.1 PAS domain-containing sensor histidine kinase [Methylosinus sp. Sm6]